MYHQWFNLVEYEKKEKALIEAIKAFGSKPIPYGEQPNYDEKMQALEKAYEGYVNYCKNGHKKQMAAKQPDELIK